MENLNTIDGQVSPIDVKEWMLQKNACYLFDLRSKEEAKATPIKPFQNIPFSMVRKVLPQIDTDNVVFLLCSDSKNSIESQKIFASCGIVSYVIRGGAQDWLQLFPS